MIIAPDFIDRLHDVDDVLATAIQYGKVLFLAAGEGTFDHDARNATHTMCDAIEEKIDTACELLNEIKGRPYSVPTNMTLKDEVVAAAAGLEHLMKLIYGGEWGVNINHESQFVVVSRIFQPTEKTEERAP